ncbi:MAG: hypothetical protein KIT58_20910 [Planctomycetota bacterium]|nr:hypothetical protein [Planctomycetota bacterium]
MVRSNGDGWAAGLSRRRAGDRSAFDVPALVKALATARGRGARVLRPACFRSLCVLLGGLQTEVRGAEAFGFRARTLGAFSDAEKAARIFAAMDRAGLDGDALARAAASAVRDTIDSERGWMAAVGLVEAVARKRPVRGARVLGVGEAATAIGAGPRRVFMASALRRVAEAEGTIEVARAVLEATP